MKTARIVSVILAMALLLVGLHAQDQPAPKMPPGHPPMGQMRGGMPPGQPGQPGQPGGQMAMPPGMGHAPSMQPQDPQQQQMRMFAKFQEMMEQQNRMVEDNTKINEAMAKQIAAMNAAKGEEKVNAVAAVLTQIFEQQKTIREQLVAMHQELLVQMMRQMGPAHAGMGGMTRPGGPTSGTMGMGIHPPMGGGMGGMGGGMRNHPPMGGMPGGPENPPPPQQ